MPTAAYIWWKCMSRIQMSKSKYSYMYTYLYCMKLWSLGENVKYILVHRFCRPLLDIPGCSYKNGCFGWVYGRAQLKPIGKTSSALSGLVPVHRAGDFPIHKQDEALFLTCSLVCCCSVTSQLWRLLVLVFQLLTEGLIRHLLSVWGRRRRSEHSVLWPFQTEAETKASVASKAPAAKLSTNKLLWSKEEASSAGRGGAGGKL